MTNETIKGEQFENKAFDLLRELSFLSTQEILDKKEEIEKMIAELEKQKGSSEDSDSVTNTINELRNYLLDEGVTGEIVE